MKRATEGKFLLFCHGERKLAPINLPGQHREGPVYTLMHCLQALTWVTGAISRWGISGDFWTPDPWHGLSWIQ